MSEASKTLFSPVYGSSRYKNSLQSSPIQLPRLLQLFQETCPALCQQPACNESVLVIFFFLVRVACSPFNGSHFQTSKASPTLVCSIEISRDIYVCRYVCLGKPIQKICMLKCVCGIWNYVVQTCACSKSVLGV